MKSLKFTPGLVLAGGAVVAGVWVISRIVPATRPADETGYNPDNVAVNVTELVTGIDLSKVGKSVGGWIYKATH